MPDLTNDSDDDLADGSYIKQISKTICCVKTVGDFTTGGKINPTVYPGLQINGIGAIGLPLVASQIQDIIKMSEQAPYGKGEETVVDTSVRNTWQLSPSQFQITNPKWDEFLQDIQTKVQKDLGVNSSIEFRLYKLLLYETGGFFKPHRDSEKENNMFATLVIQLPTKHKGSELIVTHNGQKVVYDFASESEFNFFYAAFYADCQHEVKPVTAGYRLNLVYNIVKTGASNLPSLDNTQQARLQSLVKLWENDPENNSFFDSKLKLVKVLDHQYTKAGLTFESLKNKDLAVAALLKSVDSLDIYLGQITITVSGLEYGGSHDTNNYVVEMKHVIDVNNQPVDKKFPFDIRREDPFIPRNYLSDLAEPDREKIHEETGNEGVTFERWYHRYAILFFPRKYKYDIMGIPAVAEDFQKLLENCDPSKKRSANYKNAVKFVNEVVNKTRKEGFPSSDHEIVLKGLQKLELPREYGEYMARAYYVPEGLTEMGKKYGWEMFKKPLKAAMQIRHDITAVLSIYARIAGYSKVEDIVPVLLTGPEVDVLKHITPMVFRAANRILSNNTALSIIKCFYITGQDESAVKAITNYVKNLDIHRLIDFITIFHNFLVPMATSYKPFMDLITNQLLANVALEKSAYIVPSDTSWAMPDVPKCASKTLDLCDNCKKLQTFLRDPTQKQLRFSASQSERKHISHIIIEMDIKSTTDKSSKPHTLVLEKTRDSLEERIKDAQTKIKKMEDFLVLLPPLLQEKNKANNNNNDGYVKSVKKIKTQVDSE